MGYVPQGGGEKSSQVGAAEAIAKLTGEEANTFLSLLDWSVLGRLWALLTCDEQKFFQETYSLTAEEQESRWQVAVDSHCHLDRWSIRVGVSLDHDILTHLKDHSPLVEVEINVKAMVTNFCDPPTYPDVSLLKTLSSFLQVYRHRHKSVRQITWQARGSGVWGGGSGSLGALYRIVGAVH
ncbi:hypothetical protein DPMN_050717 [Dreissena polymorpha]|uniref:Uncharacterized protein n=1 Tax=Dreissena polymorpha TaxID=45954 RepID=A0A9D4CGN1_DREPO|nr:hypothetical protein DPMN_050717 [Dreissena polymorpha]